MARMARWICFVICVCCGLLPLAASAQNGSLFPKNRNISALFVVPASGRAQNHANSLFQGSKSKFFAPVPKREAPERSAQPRSKLEGPAARLLDLIAIAEAGPAGYNAVQYGATVRPDRWPTQMTIGEIYNWIDATPGQPHAIGRYQFIPPTLRSVVKRAGFTHDTPFSPAVQDRLAMVLLRDAGWDAFQKGDLNRRTFMKNLARIWAGLPLPNGKSFYQGYAGNKATMSWVRFETGMSRIFPANT